MRSKKTNQKDPKQYDSIYKHILTNIPYLIDVITETLRLPIKKILGPVDTELLKTNYPKTLKIDKLIADKIFWCENKKGKRVLLHIEIQSSPDPTMLNRMFNYANRIIETYKEDDKQIELYQVVLYVFKKPLNRMPSIDHKVHSKELFVEDIPVDINTIDRFGEWKGIVLLFKDGFSDKVVEKIESDMKSRYIIDTRDSERYFLNTLTILGLIDDKRATTVGNKLKDTYLKISGKTMEEINKGTTGNWFLDEVKEMNQKIGEEKGKEIGKQEGMRLGIQDILVKQLKDGKIDSQECRQYLEEANISKPEIDAFLKANHPTN